jgi:hypothetical protein
MAGATHDEERADWTAGRTLAVHVAMPGRAQRRGQGDAGSVSLRLAAALSLLTCLIAVWLCVPGAGAARAGARAAETGAPTGRTARERLMGSVVRAWSARLNAGDNAGIAKLFSLPATIIQAPYVYRLVSRRQIALWESGLPCSGTIVSIAYNGRYATAVFVLGNRGATRCDAPGALAAARFEIVDGKIVSWQQVPVPPKHVSGTVA